MRHTHLTGLAALLSLMVVSSAVARDVVPWAPNLPAAKQMAAKENKLVLVHFWSVNCAPCKRLEHHVFSRRDFADQVTRAFVPVKVNVDELPATTREFRVDRWPTDVVITPGGQELLRMTSPQDAGKYTAKLNSLAAQVGVLPDARSVAGTAGRTVSAPAGRPEGRREPPHDDRRYRDARPYEDRPRAEVRPPEETRPREARDDRGRDFNGSRNAAAPRGESRYDDRSTSRYGMPEDDRRAQPREEIRRDDRRYGDSRYEDRRPAAPPRRSAARDPRQVAPPAPARKEPPQSGPQVVHGVTLPAGLPRVGLDGFCPVSLIEQRRWVKGSPQWGAIHRGRLYLFASETSKQKFLANAPVNADLFAPVLSGYDPVIFASEGKLVPGRREYGVFLNQQISLFATEENMKSFESSPKPVAGVALEAMRRAATRR